MDQIRLADLEEVTELTNNNYIMLDRPKSLTYNMSWETINGSIVNSFRNAHNGSLTKVRDDDVAKECYFEVQTNSYLDFGRKGLLQDGYLVYLNIVRPDTTLQKYPTCYFQVDGTGNKPLYNGYWYDYFPYSDEGEEKTIKTLDTYTLAPEKCMLKYSLKDDCWLIYKLDNPSGRIKWHALSNSFDGAVSLFGQEIDPLLFPTLYTIFGTKTPNLLDDVSLAGADNITYYNEVNSEQIETPTITSTGTDATTKGSFTLTGQGGYTPISSGIFTTGSMNTQTTASYKETYGYKLIANFSYDFGLTTGTRTLTRRYGSKPVWVL